MVSMVAWSCLAMLLNEEKDHAVELMLRTLLEREQLEQLGQLEQLEHLERAARYWSIMKDAERLGARRI
jgi:hypothetical protein